MSRFETTMSLQLNMRPATRSGRGGAAAPHRARHVVAMHLGSGSRRHRHAVERVADEVEPFAPLDRRDDPVDAGRPERGDRPALRARTSDERLERGLGRAVVRVGRRLDRRRRSSPRSHAPNTARLESTTARATPALPRRREQREAAVDVQLPEARRIVALAAAIAAGHMIERRMDEHVGAFDKRRAPTRAKRDRRRSTRCFREAA